MSSKRLASERPQDVDAEFETYVVVVFGASGDLAKKKTYPALFSLYCAGLLPSQVHIVGFARSKKFDDVEVFREHINPELKGDSGRLGLRQRFLSRCTYFRGLYDDDASFAGLEKYLQSLEEEDSGGKCNRLYYYAVPPPPAPNPASTW